MRVAIAIGACLAMIAGTRPEAAPLNDLERQRLVAHLEMTAAWLADEVTGLSPAQWSFKPSDTAWSIAQVVDHLLVVGPIYWNDLQAALKTPLAGRQNNTTDADMLWYGVDRTNRETAIPTEVPKGEFRDARSALAEYARHHDRLLQYIRTTKDDLRGHYVNRQGCDAYQWALLISTHEQRHILQIREIKRHARFPKS